MNNPLPCAVVRDLLPSYIEGLTEEETTKLIDEHLQQCSRCRRLHASMTQGETPSADEAAELDYLKAVRKRTTRRIVLSVLLACLVLLGAIGGKLFIWGSPVAPGDLGYEAKLLQQDSEPVLDLTVYTPGSATVLTGQKVEFQNDGSADLQLKQALSSALNRSGTASFLLPVSQLSTIRLLGMPIYENSLLIAEDTNRLWALRTPYVGNASALGALTAASPLRSMPLDFTNSLQTDAEPYGWTWEFSDTPDDYQLETIGKSAVLMLALVDNLGEMHWTYGEGHSGDISLTEADALVQQLAKAYNAAHGTAWDAGRSVKDYGESAYTLQQLREILNT